MNFPARRILKKLAATASALAFSLLAMLPAHAAELIMFDRTGCPYCVKWKQEVGPGYPNTAEGAFAPLRIHNIADGQIKDVELKRPVRFSPTFVLVDKGREIDRITGYLDNATFWGLYAPMIERLKAQMAAIQSPQKDSGK